MPPMLLRDPPRCPICHRPSDASLRPFCSTRCADVDLGRWFGESYRIEAEPETADTSPTQPA